MKKDYFDPASIYESLGLEPEPDLIYMDPDTYEEIDRPMSGFEGLKHSEESKRQMSIVRKGKKKSTETRNRMSEAAKKRGSNRTGYKASAETLKKQSLAAKKQWEKRRAAEANAGSVQAKKST